MLDRRVLQCFHGAAQLRLPLRIAGGVVAHADQQDASGSHIFRAMQPGVLALAAIKVASLDKGRNLLASGVGERLRQVALLAQADNEGISFDFVQWTVAYGEIHVVSKLIRAANNLK